MEQRSTRKKVTYTEINQEKKVHSADRDHRCRHWHFNKRSRGKVSKMQEIRTLG